MRSWKRTERRSRNLLKFNDRRFTVIRRGSMESTMTFEKGKKHRSLYRTPFGNLEIGTFATRLLILKSDEKIRIEADYDLELNGSMRRKTALPSRYSL